MNKTVKPKNKLGEFHGYQEWYTDQYTYPKPNSCNLPLLRANAYNGFLIGYEEDHLFRFANYIIR